MTWPWIMTQRWQHLLYQHYRVDEAELRALLPDELEIDTFDGSAWVSLIPLLMNHVHLRDVIPVPTTNRFPEMNLRTYVHRKGVQGVWFLSIDACSWFSVQIARRAFHIPYFDADMTFTPTADGYHFTSRRSGPTEVRYEAEYRPTGTPGLPPADSVHAFLAERYCMYSTSASGKLLRGDISHSPWHIQGAEVSATTDNVLTAIGLHPLADPVVAYSPGTQSVAWPMCSAG
jgi:uncharacterized protein YqjF (DUF2071 family)